MKFKRFIPIVCDKAKKIGCGPFVAKAVLFVVDKFVLLEMFEELKINGYFHNLFAGNGKKRDRPI